MLLSEKKYKVDYNGQKDFLKGAKDLYKAGEEVRVSYNFIATDTSYYFFIDGEPVNPDFSEAEGFIIKFIMPEHDVSLKIESVNSMLRADKAAREAVLLFDSFDGGGPSFEVEIEDKTVAACSQTHRYFNPEHETMCGSGYEVKITFSGLKPGKTRAVLRCRSDIADNYDAVYGIAVDDDLTVTVTEREKKNLIRP